MENTSNQIESEIAELSQLIEVKKRQLEQQNGITPEDRDAVSEVVKEHLGVPSPAPASVLPTVAPMTAPISTSQSGASDDYLDALSSEDATAVNSYISAIPVKGFKQTVETVKSETPYLMDLFHDALVTKLYDELKARGYIK